MAMMKCPDCGKEISTLAKSCPNCGRPTENQKAYLPNNDEITAFCPVCASRMTLLAILPDEYRVVNNGAEEKKNIFVRTANHGLSQYIQSMNIDIILT